MSDPFIVLIIAFVLLILPARLAREAAWVLLVFLVVGIVGIDYAAPAIPLPLPPAQAGCQATTHQLR